MTSLPPSVILPGVKTGAAMAATPRTGATPRDPAVCLMGDHSPALRKRAESYTFFRLVGDITGKRVLDLASGFGFYTRQLRPRGAAQVVGVDISPEMVRLAREKAQDDPDGIAYLVYDAAQLPRLGRFD